MATFNRAQFQAQLRAAQREAQRKVQAEVDRVNRENKRRVDAYNRRVEQHNRQVALEAQRRLDAHNREVVRVNAHNEQVNQHNRRVNAQNGRAVAEINRRLRAASSVGPVYTTQERSLADRIQEQAALHPEREWDAFLSYARIDGAEVGASLRDALDALGVAVFFDELAIRPGQSQALQLDRGLRSARCGIALLTPAYLAGRFWTERELGRVD